MLFSFSSNTFQRDLSGCTGRGMGVLVLLEILCRGVPHSSPVTLFQTKKFHFSHPFSDLASKKLCHHFYQVFRMLNKWHANSEYDIH